MTFRTAPLVFAALTAAALAGCSTAVPAAPHAPAPRVVVEANVDRFLDALEQLPSNPDPGELDEETKRDIASGRTTDSRRKSQEGYGRSYCEAIIRGVPIREVVADVFDADMARLEFPQDSARLAGEILCPVP